MAKRNTKAQKPEEPQEAVAVPMVAVDESTAAPVAQDDGDGYDPVTVEGKIPPPARAMKYWLGTLKSCPYYNVIVAGEDFPRITEDLPEDPLDTSRYPRPGKTRELTDAQVDKIKLKMTERVLRILGTDKNGTATRAQILDTTDPMYRREPFDHPLAAYVYMVKVGERMPPDWREKEPPAMLRPA